MASSPTKKKQSLPFNVIREVVACLVQANLPVLLWSGPGMGKTAAGSQLAKKLGWGFYCFIGSIREPQDILGNPVASEDGYVHMMPPHLAKQLQDESFLLMLDELTTCQAPMQAALLRLINERQMGEVDIKCRIIAAANPPESAVGGGDIYAPVANRLVHIPWNMTAQDFATGLATDWEWTMPRVKDGWEADIPSCRQLIGEFLSNFRSELLDFPPAEGEYAYATPRSWDMAARFLAAARSAALSANHISLGLRGTVGSGPATEFTAWLALRSTVSVEDLIKDPAMQLDKLKAESDDVLIAVFNQVVDMTMAGKIDERRMHTVFQAAIGKNFKANVLQAALARGKEKGLSRERVVALERAIKKHTDAWSGAGTDEAARP